MKHFSIPTFEQNTSDSKFWTQHLDFELRTTVSAEISDLAVLQGAESKEEKYNKSYLHEDYEPLINQEKTANTGLYWISAATGEHNYTYSGTYLDDYLPDDWTRFSCNTDVILSNELKSAKPTSTNIATRITIPYSEIKNECTKQEKDKVDKILEVEYGEYPQTIATQKIQIELTKKYSNGTLLKTDKTYIWDKEYQEYEYQEEKYIYYQVKKETKLKGKIYRPGENVWIKVEPVRWWVDKKKRFALTEKCLFAGIPFDIKEEYTGEFSQTYLKKYIDAQFSKDIIASRLTNPKTNYQFDEIFGKNYEGMINRLKRLNKEQQQVVIESLKADLSEKMAMIEQLSQLLNQDEKKQNISHIAASTKKRVKKK